jgi:hypothetical protein
MEVTIEEISLEKSRDKTGMVVLSFTTTARRYIASRGMTLFTPTTRRTASTAAVANTILEERKMDRVW